ncbi:MAG: SpoIIE family protein phosphatase [Bacteroidales bacterium]|nr:SpoIIE family protein phosphatase [Bacteroidales bacterium]
MTLLEIILIALVSLMAVIIAVGILSRKRFALRTARRLDTRYTALLREAESDNIRLRTLYDELKKSIAAPKSSATNSTSNVAQIIDIERLAAEQKKLEVQQAELTDRNRQLWDMSVSIEKERQHIQTLKNEIEAQHKEVTSSIRYAKLIQNAVLPSEEILKESFEDVFLFWRPRDIVSGDYYWMRRIGNTVIFTVADCTGHGVPGAFMSMLGVAFLNEICVNFTPDTSPAQILEDMRQKVITTLNQRANITEQKDGMDMALCILDLSTMKMQFSGANNGVYHVRGSQLTEYKAIKNPIGIHPKMKPFENTDIDVQHGDYIYMFSDGFADQFSDTGKKYTSKRMRELITDINTKTKSASEQAQLLNAALDEWKGNYHQMDDILIGGYRIK